MLSESKSHDQRLEELEMQGRVYVAGMDSMSRQIIELSRAVDRLRVDMDSMPERFAQAVTGEIRRAAADPELWANVLLALRTQAKQQAGGWLLGGLGSVLNRAAWVVVIGAGVYLLGGWSALVGFFKSPPMGQ